MDTFDLVRVFHIWLLTARLSPGDTWQIWTSYSVGSRRLTILKITENNGTWLQTPAPVHLPNIFAKNVLCPSDISTPRHLLHIGCRKSSSKLAARLFIPEDMELGRSENEIEQSLYDDVHRFSHMASDPPFGSHGRKSLLKLIGAMTKWQPFSGRHFKCIFLNENAWILIKNSLKFVPNGLINNSPALIQIMAWRRPGDKPLS